MSTASDPYSSIRPGLGQPNLSVETRALAQTSAARSPTDVRGRRFSRGGPVTTSDNTAPAIRVTGLTKRYGDKVAVDNLTFDISSGVVSGFLGPNGSGKTTTLRMIFGFARPTSGTALIDGVPFRDLDQPARHAGILIDGAGAHPRRSARDHLRAIAAERDLSPSRVVEVLNLVELTADADRKVGGFSLGMRQRLDLATALLAQPQLLVLDEPANGLDPAGIRWLRGFLRSLADGGATVFVSSHQLAELNQLADEVVVINRGRLVTHTTIAALTATGSVRVRSPQADMLASAVEAQGAQVRHIDGDALEVVGLRAEDIGCVAAVNGAVLYELTPKANSLEDVFLQLTEQEGAAS